MPPCSAATQSHYDRFLAEQYLWMSGGFLKNAEQNQRFFAENGIVPHLTGTAVDLGAGCGFQAIPLAEAGFRVTAVDFSRPMLEELRRRDPGNAVGVIAADILDFPQWAGRDPEIITCMGDTLTHLGDSDAVDHLVRQCYAELVPGGRLILAFRDYSAGSPGDVQVIPVRRDSDRIFLCRLEYGTDTARVSDILYRHGADGWERLCSGYVKLRLSPRGVRTEMERTGFRVRSSSRPDGMVTLCGRKGTG